ncbi:MAG: hypothetical protein JXR59_10865 [Desulfuromonadaceae bacterium]|nr:hypothetical protein [Desulfuromonadaceae bacterium]
MNASIRLVLCSLCLSFVSACSHLHVDLDANWKLAPDARVVVAVEDPPAGISGDQVVAAVQRLGWQDANDRHRADARLLCRWQRVIDLDADNSRPILTVKSFHARLINATTEQVLGVSDYFYAAGEPALWPGVEEALKQLYRRITISAPTAAVTPAGTESPTKPPELSSGAATENQTADSTVLPTRMPEKQESALPVADGPAPVAAAPVSEVPQAPPARLSEPDAAEEKISVSPAKPSSAGLIYHPQPHSAVLEKGAQIETSHAPESMQTSPWVPRFQGTGLETWGQEQPAVPGE